MTAILGISAFYHDSAAALIVDGKIIAAAHEERFTRKKHDESFPQHAVQFCFNQAGISASELDYVGFYEKPLMKFDRLMETYLSYAPTGFRSFWNAMPNWITQKLHLRREIKNGLDGQFKRRIVFCQHHQSHAASAFYPSPFDEAAILTMDGVGEWATSTLGMGRGNQITLTDEIRFPHSLGLLYSAFTYYCGFRVNSGEYKLMGLAPYGEPQYVDQIYESLVTLFDDGSFRLNLSAFGYCQSLRMTTSKFHDVFGRPPREPESEMDQLYKDVAASIQKVTEDIVIKSATHLHQKTGAKNLCMAGGVALNGVANGRLLREGPFERIWVQPGSGDAGGALGVASLIWHQLLRNGRKRDHEKTSRDRQQGSLLGPSYSADQAERVLVDAGATTDEVATYERIDDPAELHRRTVGLLKAGLVVGRFVGRAEFGPRALGNRSILGDPRDAQMQSAMNLRIKFRESFRPFAPVVLKEFASDHFDIQPDQEAPYMNLVCQVKHDRFPAITHVDGSARIQTVDDQRNPAFANLLKEFHRQTDCPVLINTSFNVRGEPIVDSPLDAYRCFQKTNMDAVVIENSLLIKEATK